MSKFSVLCEKYFNKTNIYEILNIESTADDKQVRKAYHKLSLKVHPDRVSEGDKEEATEKFKILSRIYSILSTPDKRSVYDETGCVDDEDDVDGEFDWLNFWKRLFKPLSHDDIREYELKYKNSEEEAMDLKKAYLNGKGDMNFIIEMVPFTQFEDEPRLKEIVQKWVEAGDVPEFDEFFHECPKKAARRKRKYLSEARKADLVASPADKEESGEEALRQIIASRQKNRECEMSSFYDQLAAKYGGEGTKKKAKPKPKAVKPAPAKKRKRN